MKATVEFNNFKKAIEKVEKLNIKSDNKSLEGIYITTSQDNSLILRRDNLDIQLNIKVPADIEEMGDVILLKSTSKLLKNIKKNSEMIIKDELIKLGSKEIKFKRLSEEYPVVNHKIDDKEFEVTQKELLRLLSCSYCMSNEECRPILKGVNIKNNVFCALDGYRISIRESEEFTSDINMTIPTAAVKLLEKLLDSKSDEIVKVYINREKNNSIKFEFGSIELITKVMEEQYIKYEGLIRDEYSNTTILNVNDDELKEKLNLINKSIEKSVLEILINKAEVNMFSKDSENEIKDNISCKDISGEEIKIGLNGKYFSEAIFYHEDIFKMYFRSAREGIIITNDYKNLEFVLPIRLK